MLADATVAATVGELIASAQLPSARSCIVLGCFGSSTLNTDATYFTASATPVPEILEPRRLI
jgi:hypothetical protein